MTGGAARGRMAEKKDEEWAGKDAEEKAQAERGVQELEYALIELGDKLGDGGVGMTYAARYRREAVAVKMLFNPRMDRDLRREFMDEVLVLSDLSHANVVSFLGAVTRPPNLCFAMELCDGSLFSALHVERRRLSRAQRMDALLDVASGVAYLHGRSPPVLHRDLKSQNVLFGRDGRLKLCDFGLSRSRVAGQGTVAYMAPELLSGGSFGPKVDVYAFGVLAWEVLCGRIPFAGLEVPEIKREVLEGQRPPLGRLDAPGGVADVIEDCWAEAQGARPRMEDVLERLDALRPQMEDAVSHTEKAFDAFGGDALDMLMDK